MEFIKLFLGTAIFAFIMDMIWLGYIAKDLYDTNIGFMLRKSGGALSPIWPAAFIVYIAIVIGILFFALPKAEGSYVNALIWGAVFGFVLYAVYDFTNYSILANWPLQITLLDTLWGMTLCGSTTCFALFIQKWLAS